MQIGDKLFEFTLKGVDGKEYSNYHYADRYALLLVITSNHCPYSRAYWGRLKNLANRYEEDNLGLVALNSNDPAQQPDDSFDNMVKLANDLELNFLYLDDTNQEVARKLGAQRTPEVFLFNSKRELVYKGAIDDSWENPNMVTNVYLEDAIECALDGIDVDYPEMPAVGCGIKWKQ